MVRTDEEKQLAIDAKASKLWRTLRIASKSKLNLFDKIDDGNNLDALFEPENKEDKEHAEVNGTEENQVPSIKEVTPIPIEKDGMAAMGNGVEAVQEAVVK